MFPPEGGLEEHGTAVRWTYSVFLGKQLLLLAWLPCLPGCVCTCVCMHMSVCAGMCMQVCVCTYACVGADKGPLNAMTDRYSQYSTKAGSLSSQICFLLTQAHLVFGQGLDGWTGFLDP